MTDRRALSGYAMVLASAVGFASYGVWSRQLGPDFAVFYQAWVRSGLVLLVLVPVALLTGSLQPVPREQWRWLGVTVVAGAATQAPIYYAFNAMDIGTASLLFFASFLIVCYLVGAFALGERIGMAKLVALALAFLGLALVFGFSLAQFSLLAAALAMVNGVASGVEVSSSKKTTTEVSSLQVVICVWLATLVTHLPLSLLLDEPQVPPAWDGRWAAMAAYTAVSIVSFWLVVEGFRFIDAGIGGLLGLLEVVAAVGFGILVFDEQLRPTVVAGGALILAAGMLPDLVAMWGSRRSRADTRRPRLDDAVASAWERAAPDPRGSASRQ